MDGEIQELHGSRDKKGDGHARGGDRVSGIKRHDRHATDTGRQESRLGWGRHYVRPPFTVLHLPLTTFRANKSWFLSSLFPHPRLSRLSYVSYHPPYSSWRFTSSRLKHPSMSRPSVSLLYLFRCLPPHQLAQAIRRYVLICGPVSVDRREFSVLGFRQIWNLSHVLN